MMKQLLIYILVMLILVPQAIDADTWKNAKPHYQWSFPKDHWRRDGYKTEWWYFTGHLEGEEGSRFGYQFTFFRVGLTLSKPGLAFATFLFKNVVNLLASTPKNCLI